MSSFASTIDHYAVSSAPEKSVSLPREPAPVYPADTEPVQATLPTSRRRQLVQAAKASSWINRKTLACFMSLAVSGWSDSTAGPLLPYIQDDFAISYIVVSQIWVGQACGFIIASFANVHLTHYLGEGKTFFLGAMAQCLAYIFIIPALPFPVMCLAYAVNGFGMALQDAQANTYIAGLPSAAQKLGVLHAVYGLGALITPLACTALIEHGIRWTNAYAILLGLSAVNAITVLWGFRLQREPQPNVMPAPTSAETEAMDDDAPAAVDDRASVAASDSANARLKRVMTSKTVWLFCAFILLYVGAEVSTGGWVATFLISERDGGVKSGYVVSGFWAGLTLGRLLMPTLMVRIGEWHAIAGLLLITTIFELTIWFTRSFVANSVFYAITGFLIGPMYPSAVSLSTKILPRSMHTGAIGFLASLGQTGSAVVPFLVGALAQRFSPIVLQPVLVIMFVLMMGVWLVVPRPKRSSE